MQIGYSKSQPTKEKLSLNWGQCHSKAYKYKIGKHFKLLSNDIRARSPLLLAQTVTPRCCLTLYISVCQTYYVGDDSLAFCNSTSAYPSLAPLAQYFLAAPASQAYVERVFSICGDLTAGNSSCLCKKLANRTFLKMNNKFYD